MVPGDPAIVREARVEVAGEGKDQRRVAEAVAGFAPKVGDGWTMPLTKPASPSSTRACVARDFWTRNTLSRRVTVRPEEHSAEVDLSWESGPRYKFGAVRFAAMRRFPKNSCVNSCLGARAPISIQSKCSTCNSGWWMPTISSWCRCNRRSTRRRTAPFPLDVLLKRDERTVYSGEVYYSTDFGGGVRLGAERRWLNQKGHKADAKIEYSKGLQEAAVHYKIPRPSREDRSYDFGVGYRDETTDVNRSRNFQLAATRSEKRWHGFTRTLGIKYLFGDFEIGQDEDNLEYGSSKLLFAEGTLSRSRVNDRLAPRKGYVLEFGGRLASDAIVSDTDLAQVFGRITWLMPQGDDGRFKLRGEVGAMSVGNFDALPPDLRFYAGGDRSLRGFDYHEIGEVNANGNIIGGEFLAVASAEYEHYFSKDWGAAVFVDAGDAFIDGFSLNVGAGVGVRWRSPLGPIRVDIGFPVQSELPTATSWRLHVLLGPDL